MKKILGILVLSLLLSGNAYAKVSLKELVKVGSSKSEVCKAGGAIRGFTLKEDLGSQLCHSISKDKFAYNSTNRTEILSTGSGAWFVFENVTRPMKCGVIFCRKGDGTLKKLFLELDYSNKIETIKAAYKFASIPLPIEIAEEKKKKEEKKIAEKPKKKEPKPTPDDNKIVPAGSGSGFFVSREGHIITNHHVIDECNTTKVSFKGNQIDAQIIAVDKTNDIAILKANIKPNSIFPVSNEDVSLLEDVVVAGYPLGKKVSSAIKTHKGVVTALAGAGDNFSNFQTDASINAGNSGGPIMNQKGNIVGIAVATWVEDGVQGVHFGIKSSTLKTFASSNSLAFTQPNNRDLSNKDLGELITEATVYLECHMTVANIKKMIAAANNRKAFFSEFK